MLINPACGGSASYSTRSRPDPYGSLTHLTILFSILTSVTSPSAVRGPNVARRLTMFGQLFLELLLLCSRARHHQIVAVSEHRQTCQLRSSGTDKAKTCVCRTPSQSWHSHSQHQSIVQRLSFHTWLPTTRTLVIFFWRLDHDHTTCQAVRCALLMS